MHTLDVPDTLLLHVSVYCQCTNVVWLDLGALCEKEGWRELIHRRKRCDLSLFQLGLRILEHFLNEELPILVQFHVTI